MAFNIRKLTYILLLYSVFYITNGTQDKYIMVLQPTDVQELRQQGEICSKEIEFSLSALNEIIFKWPVPDTRDVKQLYQCIRHNAGYTDDNGHMIIEKFLSLKLMNGTQEKLTEVLKECNKITLEDTVETTYAVGTCLHTHCAFVVKSDDSGNDGIF